MEPKKICITGRELFKIYRNLCIFVHPKTRTQASRWLQQIASNDAIDIAREMTEALKQPIIDMKFDTCIDDTPLEKTQQNLEHDDFPCDKL